MDELHLEEKLHLIHRLHDKRLIGDSKKRLPGDQDPIILTQLHFALPPLPQDFEALELAGDYWIDPRQMRCLRSGRGHVRDRDNEVCRRRPRHVIISSRDVCPLRTDEHVKQFEEAHYVYAIHASCGITHNRPLSPVAPDLYLTSHHHTHMSHNRPLSPVAPDLYLTCSQIPGRLGGMPPSTLEQNVSISFQVSLRLPSVSLRRYLMYV